MNDVTDEQRALLAARAVELYDLWIHGKDEDMDQKTGVAVAAQSRDNGFFNTEPAVAKAIVVGGATSIGIALGAFGLVTEEQRTTIIEQVGSITYGLFVVLPIVITVVNAAWTRLSTFSPRSAALAAVKSAKSGIPTLDAEPQS